MNLRLAMLAACIGLLKAQSNPVDIHQETQTFPTYDEGAPDPNPQFDTFYRDIFPNYPYTIRTPINKTRKLTPWRVVVMENEYLSCRILPDLGGHLHGCTDKITNKEIFYANPVIRRTTESTRGEFVAMGIESSFPITHSRVTGSPVDFGWLVTRDGVGRVTVEDTDRTTGMQWRVEFLLRPGSAVLEQRGTVYNGSLTRRGYQWWVNAAIELDDPHLRILYPVKWMLPHNTTEMTAWPIDDKGVDLSDAANHKEAIGLFAHLSHEPWMAIYKPKFRSGVAHYADPRRVAGKKIWLWGATDTYVQKFLTEDFNSYVEMQAGELETQPEFGFLLPGQKKTYAHYWIPFHDLGGVSRATPEAVLNLSRKGASLTVELQTTHIMKGAKLRLSEGSKTVWEGSVDLDPRVKYARTLEVGKATVELTDAHGSVALHQVEGDYDAAPFDRSAKNPEPVVPVGDSDDEASSLARGAYNEQRDDWAFAWADYERGLKRTPGSIKLTLAAGRAAVALKRYSDAIRVLQDVADANAEGAYYYGVALASGSDHVAQAEAALTMAAKDVDYATAAKLRLALLEAREKGAAGMVEAVHIVQALAAKSEATPRLGALEVALLRRAGKLDEAKMRLAFWLEQDPADEMLRVERTLIRNIDDSALWNHLAADPERVLNLAEEYRQMGGCDDALRLLDRRYTAPPDTEREPGKVLPQDYPLVAYFRGYCRLKTGQDAKADFATGSQQSTLYVFPHREIEFRIFQAALAQNSEDAVAHDLLGDLHFDSFQTDEAIREWKEALRLKKDLPALHRNLGRALVDLKQDRVGAVGVLTEGQALAPNDREIAHALSTLDVAPAVSAAMATLAPVEAAAPTAAPSRTMASSIEGPKGDLAGRALVRSVTDVSWAASQFTKANFPKEKQPEAVRQAYVEVQLRLLLAGAQEGHCDSTMEGLENLGEINESLPFTYQKLADFMKQPHFQYYMGLVESLCGQEKAAKKRWSKVSKSKESADSADFVFPYLAAKRLGEEDAAQRIAAALKEVEKTPLDDGRPTVAFLRGALLVAAGKKDEGNALLEKAASSSDSFLQYMSLAVMTEAQGK